MGTKRILAIALLLLGLVGQAGAVTWTVVTSTDCTALNTPAPCCVSSNAADNDACNKRLFSGDVIEVLATFATTTGTYTTGGDALAAAQVAKLGLSKVLAYQCGPVESATTTGFQTALTLGQSGGAPTISVKLFNLFTGSGLTPAELANATALTNPSFLRCRVIGR